jgi:hypothetical protein
MWYEDPAKSHLLEGNNDFTNSLFHRAVPGDAWMWLGGEEETGLLAEKFGAPLNGGIYFFSVHIIMYYCVIIFDFFAPHPVSLLVYLCIYRVQYRARETTQLLHSLV